MFDKFAKIYYSVVIELKTIRYLRTHFFESNCIIEKKYCYCHHIKTELHLRKIRYQRNSIILYVNGLTFLITWNLFGKESYRQMEASKLKWVNSMLDAIGFNSLVLEGLQILSKNCNISKRNPIKYDTFYHSFELSQY